MKKTILKIFFVLDIIAILIYVVCSQFLILYDTSLGVTCDGFGRALTQAPLFFRSSFLGIEEWAGFGWFCVDTLCSFGLLIIGFVLFKQITKE